jgi:HAD superfamily hydrolase (TIGR01509 family)
VIDAVIFDFDGLILDTETAHYETWRDLYTEHGHTLTLEAWESAIGGISGSFNALNSLVALLDGRIDPATLKKTRTERYLRRVYAQPILAGVDARIAEARALGLKVGVASSSSCDWVHNHLKRLGLWDRFDHVTCGDEVPQVKPDPAVYNLALERLGVTASRAVAFEDSPKGIEAAKRAGLFCIAIPNTMTAGLDLAMADMRAESLDDVSLEEIVNYKLRITNCIR